jgi:hypothetical protein
VLFGLAPARASAAPPSGKEGADVTDALVTEAQAPAASNGDEAGTSRLRLAYEASGRPGPGLALARRLAMN